MEKNVLMDDKPPLSSRGPGRPATGKRVKKVTIMLTFEQYEWALEQPEGLSGLMRLLVTKEQARRRRSPSPQKSGAIRGPRKRRAD